MGPKPRSYRQRTPKKMIQLALRSALSDRAAEGRIAIVESWNFEVPRTKDAVEALAALGVEGRALVVLGDDDVAYRSFRNLPWVQPILASELNAYDVLCNDWVVFTPANLPGSARGYLEEGPAAGEAAMATGPQVTPPMTAGGAPGEEVPVEADALPGDAPPAAGTEAPPPGGTEAS